MVSLPRKLVAAGLITDERGRVLIAQRRADQAHALQWEFPGGKIESGESPVRALERELLEELGARVDVGAIWDVLHHDYGAFEVIMLVYHCRAREGERAHCVQVADLAWCTPSELYAYAILPADAPLVARLSSEGVPAWKWS
jgi:8-oxo-dGTP diphosphatase